MTEKEYINLYSSFKDDFKTKVNILNEEYIQSNCSFKIGDIVELYSGDICEIIDITASKKGDNLPEALYTASVLKMTDFTPKQYFTTSFKESHIIHEFTDYEVSWDPETYPIHSYNKARELASSKGMRIPSVADCKAIQKDYDLIRSMERHGYKVSEDGRLFDNDSGHMWTTRQFKKGNPLIFSWDKTGASTFKQMPASYLYPVRLVKYSYKIKTK